MKNKKALLLHLLLVSFFLFARPALAQTATSNGDVSQIQTFIQSIISILVTLATLVAGVFFVLGGFGYITSSGNPENLDRSKKTIVYSAVGLAISIGALVLTNIVTSVAQNAFGK